MINCLVNTELFSVEFVQDYLQLHFNGPILTALIMPTVIVSGIPFCIDEPGYRDSLCSLIGDFVIGVEQESDKFIIVEFTRGRIEIRFDEKRYVETAVLTNGSSLQIWPR